MVVIEETETSKTPAHSMDVVEVEELVGAAVVMLEVEELTAVVAVTRLVDSEDMVVTTAIVALNIKTTTPTTTDSSE